jgi:hypothetical protein
MCTIYASLSFRKSRFSPRTVNVDLYWKKWNLLRELRFSTVNHHFTGFRHICTYLSPENAHRLGRSALIWGSVGRIQSKKVLGSASGTTCQSLLCNRYLFLLHSRFIYGTWIVVLMHDSGYSACVKALISKINKYMLIYIYIYIQGEYKNLTISKWYWKQMRRTKNFTPTPVDRKTLRVLFQMTRVIVVFARFR